MVKRSNRYTFAQTVAMLKKQDINPLSLIPQDSEFAFEYDMDDNLRLHIGNVCGNVPVWANFVARPNKWVVFESGKVFFTRYTVEDFEGKVELIVPFSRLKQDREGEGEGEVKWDDMMKALVPFLFLRAGHIKHFVDFEEGKGMQMLAKALECLPVPVQRADSVVQDDGIEDCAEGHGLEEEEGMDLLTMEKKSVVGKSSKSNAVVKEKSPVLEIEHEKQENVSEKTAKQKRTHDDFLEGEESESKSACCCISSQNKS
ncbi:hypothetical protein K504DRAFT_293227 [Pleomassaria siparia CBS 279.74]|uniref:Uncharacterized protein n=1 Tax=Pleomassaria siparia CBS 279.74 TaxID=1314801 RepID=A0A6G1K9E7_9PLEO|nr:hypothetical protein K504DRAFT_293227 [Pleomassaria siparia CBS 279.74]